MPTGSFHNEIRHGILSIINMLHDLDQGARDSAASVLAGLAKHSKQELEIIMAGVTSNKCQQSSFMKRLDKQFYP